MVPPLPRSNTARGVTRFAKSNLDAWLPRFTSRRFSLPSRGPYPWRRTSSTCLLCPPLRLRGFAAVRATTIPTLPGSRFGTMTGTSHLRATRRIANRSASVAKPSRLTLAPRPPQSRPPSTQRSECSLSEVAAAVYCPEGHVPSRQANYLLKEETAPMLTAPAPEKLRSQSLAWPTPRPSKNSRRHAPPIPRQWSFRRRQETLDGVLECLVRLSPRNLQPCDLGTVGARQTHDERGSASNLKPLRLGQVLADPGH